MNLPSHFSPLFKKINWKYDKDPDTNGSAVWLCLKIIPWAVEAWLKSNYPSSHFAKQNNKPISHN